MTKKTIKTDVNFKDEKSNKNLTKYIKVSETFIEISLVLEQDVKTLFKDLVHYYEENKNIFIMPKLSKSLINDYKMKPIKEVGVFESSVNFAKTFELSTNQLFSLLLVFRTEHDTDFLFKIKNIDFKKEYKKDTLTAMFLEYNKTNQELYKQNLALKKQIDDLINIQIREREEFQKARLEEKEARIKDRDNMKKILSAMQELNASNIRERANFQSNFTEKLEKIENKFEVFVHTIEVISDNLNNLIIDNE